MPFELRLVGCEAELQRLLTIETRTIASELDERAIVDVECSEHWAEVRISRSTGETLTQTRLEPPAGKGATRWMALAITELLASTPRPSSRSAPRPRPSPKPAQPAPAWQLAAHGSLGWMPSAEALPWGGGVAVRGLTDPVLFVSLSADVLSAQANAPAGDVGLLLLSGALGVGATSETQPARASAEVGVRTGAAHVRGQPSDARATGSSFVSWWGGPFVRAGVAYPAVSPHWTLGTELGWFVRGVQANSRERGSDQQRRELGLEQLWLTAQVGLRFDL